MTCDIPNKNLKFSKKTALHFRPAGALIIESTEKHGFKITQGKVVVKDGSRQNKQSKPFGKTPDERGIPMRRFAMGTPGCRPRFRWKLQPPGPGRTPSAGIHRKGRDAN
jgi:hypothetical protein